MFSSGSRPSNPKRHCILLILACVAGCGSDQLQTWPARGRVVFPDGAPVRTGTIELRSQDHNLTASGRINTDGSFVLGTYEIDDGAVAGTHDVIVLQLIVNDGTVNHTMDHGRSVAPGFSTYESSGLITTVAEQDNDLTIEVTAR